ncbi:phage tail protein [Mitsuaria sp. GD03876]|uniref:phage tail protein n=1 Tax=Mitsuaria sp. GD03876 TaxID=2975399 RepID=UPI00244766CE|nr:phage tail protein [Mitsuaria sp. GD03876]MDH0866448.1 phage tail protein [Mitsuaria sp. GD03876]
MLKPNSLREHLSQAVPALRRDPDKLSVFLKEGKLVAAAGETLSFEYRYTLNLVLLDYAEHADAVMVPLLAWLRVNQPEIAENPDLREKALRFEVEFLNSKTVDLSIEVDLTERVLVQPRKSASGFDVKHLGEPAHVGQMPAGERWDVYFAGDLLASWTYPA